MIPFLSCLVPRRSLWLGAGLAAASSLSAAPGDENWDARFRLPGFNGPVKAMVSAGASVYFGGDFNFAGSTWARSIARWDGTNWFELDGGVDGVVNAIVVQNGQVYVGGKFHSAGGVNATNIARWDGANWHAVGGGVSDTIEALASNGVLLFAGGAFRRAGSVAANLVARWDGSQWSPLGTGLDDQGEGGEVYALATEGAALYAGGSFSRAGSKTVNSIAKWNGSEWSDMGNGLFYNAVHSLAVSGTTVFAGGQFYMPGIGSVYNFARWDGSSWSTMGSWFPGQVACILVNGPELYLGVFPGGGGHTNGFMVLMWDGADWIYLAETTPTSWWENPGAAALALFQGDLYAGGTFQNVDRTAAKNIAHYDHTRWSSLESGPAHGLVLDTGPLLIDGSAAPMAVDGSDVYVTGTLMLAGGLQVTNLAKWNGANWLAIPCALNEGGSLAALAASHGTLYIGGKFSSVEGVAARNIARWDGTNWSPLTEGLDDDSYSGAVNAILLRGAGAIVGGSFTHAGGVLARNIASWDGAEWSALGGGLVHAPSGGGAVYALAARQNTIYAGGFFNNAEGASVPSLAQWDGAHWSAVGGNPPVQGFGFFTALAVVGHDLYAGGSYLFDQSSGGSFIGKWDGTNWSGLGSGVIQHETGYASVSALAAGGGDLYVSGYFDTAGGFPANGVARWDGRAWSALGSGISGNIASLGVGGNELYVSGSFSAAGVKPSSSFGLWHIPPRLNALRVGASWQLSWSTQYVGYTLQTATDLRTSNWMETHVVPNVVNGLHTVTTNVIGPQRYFRLQRP